MAKKSWGDLGSFQKGVIGLLVVAQLGLMVATIVDVWTRPSEEIRGRKRIWFAAAFVNYVGPLTYYLVGRKR